MKVLHITNWYPNLFNANEAVWIERQIDALTIGIENKVIHFEIFQNKKLGFKKIESKRLSQYLIKLPNSKWFIIELIHFLFLINIFLIKRKHRKYDIINFHIAYPMLTYWHWIKRFVNKPVVINEHWSAYHFNFGMNKSLPRIQKIFRHNIPVIAVSKALVNDIKQFAKTEFPSFVLPNVVDKKIFYVGNNPRDNFCFMVSQWKTPKTPITVIQAFANSPLAVDHQLIIGGYGPLWSQMKKYVDTNNLKNKIKFVGKLEAGQIADYLRKCKAFFQPTDYETFSVVCAEAVACGAYVIAPDIGGISEVLGSKGMLIKENRLEDWQKAFDAIPSDNKNYSDLRFSKENIGVQYRNILNQIFYEFKE